MALIQGLGLVCVSLLLLRGVVPLYTRAGDDVTLPCAGLRRHGPACSGVNWVLYQRALSNATYEVRGGVVRDGGSSRMSLNSDCSLSLQNITEDDFGQFDCYLNGRGIDTRVYLNVLTVSPAPVDPSEDPGGNITLQCRLWSYDVYCKNRDFRWLDQSQTVLPVRRTNCTSYLTVERQSPHHRTFTCQFVKSGEVKVSAEYRLRGNKETGPDPEGKNQTRGNCEESKGWSWFLVLKTVGWSALISATVVVSICTREKGKPKRSSGDFEMASSFYVNPGNTAPSTGYEN